MSDQQQLQRQPARVQSQRPLNTPLQTVVTTPQSRCQAALAECDITPPVGIFHRMWGAALHDQATGIHRPLIAGLLWLAPLDRPATSGQLIVSLDHCILDRVELDRLRTAIASSTGLPVAQILITLTHTHGSGWMSRSRALSPGGELIGPYLDQLAVQLARVAATLSSQLEPVTIVYGQGRCSLARHRDAYDPQQPGFVCGFNPAGPADDTLIVGRIVSSSGETLGVIVNYACHPTTLAWQNTLISPDWVGAMRDVVVAAESTGRAERAPVCLFLQGASGELGPAECYVGDPAIADRNGRQLGYAAAATLSALPPAGTQFEYAGPVVSGAILGTWEHRPLSQADSIAHGRWRWDSFHVELPYRDDLPTIAETLAERDHWRAEEVAAIASGDTARVQESRAQLEQRTRQLARLEALVPGRVWPLPVTVGILGDVIWIFVPGEHYQSLQQSLRTRLAPRPVFVTTITNDWQPGYIPPADVFGRGIYQELIAATAPGAAEQLLDEITARVAALLS